MDVRSIELGLELQAPRIGAHGPHPTVALGASRRSFFQDDSILTTGWAPTLGLSLAQPLNLGPAWSLTPTIAAARDLRRVSYRWPDGATLDHPAWELSAALALTWSSAE